MPVTQRQSRRTHGRRRFKSDAQRKAVMATLVQKHQGLVHKEVGRTIRRIPSAGNSREDLVSAGNEGLLQFAKRYNKGRSQFSTGATQAIRNKILKEVQRSNLVRVPEKKVGKLAKKGPLPTTVDLSALKVERSKGGIEQAEARADAQKLLRRLAPTERKVVGMLYLQDRTLGQVAKQLRISSARVDKIQKKALAKLREGTKK